MYIMYTYIYIYIYIARERERERERDTYAAPREEQHGVGGAEDLAVVQPIIV